MLSENRRRRHPVLEVEELGSRLLPSVAPLSLATRQTFDGPGTAFVLGQEAAPPGPQILSGGPTGRFLRLATTTIPNNNDFAFKLTAPGRFRRIVADFDFRMIPGFGRADGIGFALLSTRQFGASGRVAPPPPRFIPEEPAFSRSLGIGFDIFQNLDVGDINANHVSVHFRGNLVTQVDVTPFLDLASGGWIHARVVVQAARRQAKVSVLLTPPGGVPVTVIDRLQVAPYSPFESRVWFGARSGGFSAEHDLDNVRVRFLRRL